MFPEIYSRRCLPQTLYPFIMKIKYIITLNIISIFLLIFSAKLFYMSDYHNKTIKIQETRIEQVKSLAKITCNDEEIKKQFLIVLTSMHDAQSSTYDVFYLFAKILLLFGVLNVVLSIVVMKKCKV